MSPTSELVWSEQRIDEVAEQQQSDHAADQVVDDHLALSLEPLAALKRQREQREGAKRQSDIEQIRHGWLPPILRTDGGWQQTP
jgi:hypothetical protein